jgi:hypothetical protein
MKCHKSGQCFVIFNDSVIIYYTLIWMPEKQKIKLISFHKNPMGESWIQLSRIKTRYPYYLNQFIHKNQMRNWDAFALMSMVIITIILFASGKVDFEYMLDDINMQETLEAIGKTIVITIFALIMMVLMLVILLVDVVVSILFRVEFPITMFIYEKLYLGFVRAWYWDDLSGSHIFLACIIIFGFTLIYTYALPKTKRKRFIYYKGKPKL